MSEVLSIRIPRELKRRIDKLKGFVDWKNEIIRFLEDRVRYYERVKIIKEVHKLLEAHPTFPRGSVVKAVREDRVSH
ncbi:MAG: CopG family transcriptional regulator [Thermoprotei archaeon]|nr:MAG: CopG family transcriptional regulator [Thermoprotei archaeon]RLF20926.1 MAG: CopG family transcriptional regulator [Thermoprotei archaeon]